MGALWLAQGNAVGAVREYSAVLALKPLDMASAEFDVAKAYMAEGDKAKAEEGVLASLEAGAVIRDREYKGNLVLLNVAGPASLLGRYRRYRRFRQQVQNVQKRQTG